MTSVSVQGLLLIKVATCYFDPGLIRDGLHTSYAMWVEIVTCTDCTNISCGSVYVTHSEPETSADVTAPPGSDVSSILCHGPQPPDNGQIRNWHLHTKVTSSSSGDTMLTIYQDIERFSCMMLIVSHPWGSSVNTKNLWSGGRCEVSDWCRAGDDGTHFITSCPCLPDIMMTLSVLTV